MSKRNPTCGKVRVENQDVKKHTHAHVDLDEGFANFLRAK